MTSTIRRLVCGLLTLLLALAAPGIASADPTVLLNLKNPSGTSLMSIDDNGDLTVANEVRENVTSFVADTARWEVNLSQNPAFPDYGAIVNLSSASVGRLQLKGSLIQYGAPSTDDIFFIKNAAGTCVASVDRIGNMKILGKVTGSICSYHVSPSGNDANSGSSWSPFKTMKGAMDYLMLHEHTGTTDTMTRNVTVYFHAGTYYFDQTELIRPIHSGNHGYRVTYAAYPGDRVVFSGGKQVTSWQLYDATKNIWKADLLADDFKTNGNPDHSKWIRQLFVNNKRAVRSRFPNMTETLETYNANSFKELSNTDGVSFFDDTIATVKLKKADVIESGLDLVRLRSFDTGHNFTGSTPPNNVEIAHVFQCGTRKLRIENVVTSSHTNWTTGTVNDPYIQYAIGNDTTTTHSWPAMMKGPSDGDKTDYHLENAYEFIGNTESDKGEWYFDVDGRVGTNPNHPRLFYKPNDNEMSGGVFSPTDVYYPLVGCILDIEGRTANWDDNTTAVANLTFDNIIFEHTKTYFTGFDGYIFQNLTGDEWYRPDGSAVILHNSRNIQFTRCMFEHIGGDAVELQQKTINNKFVGNVFEDVSANGIIESSFGALAWQIPEWGGFDPYRIPNNNEFSNNYFRKIGREYPASVGIRSVITSGTLIAYNTFEKMPSTAVQVGHNSWPAAPANLVVTHNKFQTVGGFIDDVDAIYLGGAGSWWTRNDADPNDTPGDYPYLGARFDYNYILDTHRAPCRGLLPNYGGVNAIRTDWQNVHGGSQPGQEIIFADNVALNFTNGIEQWDWQSYWEEPGVWNHLEEQADAKIDFIISYNPILDQYRYDGNGTYDVQFFDEMMNDFGFRKWQKNDYTGQYQWLPWGIWHMWADDSQSVFPGAHQHVFDLLHMKVERINPTPSTYITSVAGVQPTFQWILTRQR